MNAVSRMQPQPHSKLRLPPLLQVEVALRCKEDPRLFFPELYRNLKLAAPKISYGQLSRLCKIPSRTYVGEIFRGEKFPSKEVLEKICMALGLERDVVDALTLWSKSEAGPTSTASQRANLASRLSHLRSRLIASEEEFAVLYSKLECSALYAALGSPDSGATVTDIGARTGLKEAAVEDGLKFLIERGLARETSAKDGPIRYVAETNHLALIPLMRKEFFAPYYRVNCNRAGELCQRRWTSKTDLFFNSCFSINKSQAEKFKGRLRQLLIEFAESSENPNGDSVFVLNCGFFEFTSELE
jgi:hypothetical protein